MNRYMYFLKLKMSGPPLIILFICVYIFISKSYDFQPGPIRIRVLGSMTYTYDIYITMYFGAKFVLQEYEDYGFLANPNRWDHPGTHLKHHWGYLSNTKKIFSLVPIG